MATSKPIQGIQIVSAGSMRDERGGLDFFFTTTCVDYDAYKALPAGAELDGRQYSLTGWNSDLGLAYYKDGVRFAVAR